jgi:zinc transporter
MIMKNNDDSPDIYDSIEAWLLDGQGGGVRLSQNEIYEYELKAGEWLWLHLNYSNPANQEWLKETSGLPELTTEALLQEETRPRCVPMDGGLMLFLRGVNLNPGAEPEDMVSLRIWIDEQRIISLARRRLLTIKDMRDAVQERVGISTPGDFLTMLVNRLLDRASTVIEDLSDKTDSMENDLLEVAGQTLREQLSDIRREAIALRRYFAPQREALNRIAMDKTAILTDENRLFLREDADRLTRLIEELDADRERASVIHESLLSRLAELTNKRMYILSIIAAIFLPLSFVTGLLGINVGGIPGAESELGFASVIILMVIVVVALWAYFRWKRWF